MENTVKEQPKINLPTNPLPAVTNLGGDIKKGWKKFIPPFITPKLLMILLLVVIGIEIVYALFVLISPTNKSLISNITSNSSEDNDLESKTGKIVLTTEGESFKVGDEIPVLINISTGEFSSDGTDVVLDYDPEFLEAFESSIVEGDLYSDYPGKRVDPKRKMITISGIVTSSGEGFNGEGELARVNFKALKTGQTQVKVKFEKDSTTESNIIQSKSGADVLSEVTDVTISISE